MGTIISASLDAALRIRSTPALQDSFPALPLVVLASTNSTEARIAAFDAGADDFLVKPVDSEELVTRVRARVQRQRSVRAMAEKDPATGALRHDAFVDRANATIAAASRSGQAVAFAMLSVGQAGALPKVAQRLGERLRAYDLRGRWSDHELIVALADVDGPTAEQLFERLLNGEMDVRAGVAVFPDDESTLAKLVVAARKRLQQAARAGEIITRD